MALSSEKLADELSSLELYDNEADAISAWVLAFRNYFSDAVCNGVSVVPASLVPSSSAMQGAMAGLSSSGLGAAKIQAGIVAFWGALVPAIAFPTSTLIVPPPTLSAIAAALNAVFLANVAGKLGQAESIEAIVVVIHANNLGGTATFPIPTPTVFPIL